MKKLFSFTLITIFPVVFVQAAIVPVISDIITDTTWHSTNEYILTDAVYVKDNAILTIEAGTIIRGEPKSSLNASDQGMLVVTTEGQIDARGTSANPIIFTTAALDSNSDNIPDGIDISLDDNGTSKNYGDDFDVVVATQTIVSNGVLQNGPFLDADPLNNPLPPAIYTGSGEFDAISTFIDASGDTVDHEFRQLWGGIIILGEAPVNTNVTVAGGLNRQFIPGLPIGDSSFGGFNQNDDSGNFSYVSIRHGGARNRINGLTMGGVGFGTKIDHIEVYCSAGDGFSWVGGTVNTRYLSSVFNSDDAFDISEGFTGLGQFWFALMNGDVKNGDKGGEHDGESNDGNDLDSVDNFSIPKTYPVIYNATFIGNPNNNSEALRIRKKFGGEYHNSIFYGFGGSDAVELQLDGEVRFLLGEVLFEGNCFFDANKGLATSNYGKAASAAVEPFIDAIFGLDFSPFTQNIVVDPAFRSINRRDTTADGSGLATGAGVNPLSTTGFAIGNNGAGGALGIPETSTFFTDTNYKGAFNHNPTLTLWTTGWTALNARGVLVDSGMALSID